jgi:phenylalanyl-tRNA synthetase alpha chain
MDSLQHIQSDIDSIVEHTLQKCKLSKSFSEINELETQLLGKNGSLIKFFKHIPLLEGDNKRKLGAYLNAQKSILSNNFKNRKQELASSKEQKLIDDPTIPSNRLNYGSTHLITQTISEVRSIFSKIGFIQVSYPEIEYEYYAFDALNMPPDHPARDDFEATFLDLSPHTKFGKYVLSPHTSSGQLREMQRVKKPPFRMINIAKCYRPNWDATHTPMFHQFEGFCVDKRIHLGHLKWTLDYFAASYFGKNVKTRLRPFHFQFTEPSFEVDITCIMCSGKGIDKKDNRCLVCKSGWLELGGTGMVHPTVLKYGNIDSSKYSGWAFGFGIERIIMMKYAIDDIRLFYDNDIRFLSQW